MNRDAAFGTLTLAVAAVYYVLAVAIPRSDLADPIGPQGLPRMYAIALAALSLLLIARSITRAPSPEADSTSLAASRVPSPANVRVVGMLLIGIAYILVVPYLGYLVSVALLIAATTYFQGGTINSRSILVSITGAALFWVLFVWLLRIQYPASLWPSVI
jgi:putative tricarboxylic transport membrane protein